MTDSIPTDAIPTDSAPTSATKNCPICGELILAVARKCRFCGEYLDPSARPHAPRPDAVERMLMPVGRPISAIASGYLALFAILPLIGLAPAIASIICGVVALKSIREDPSLVGKGRAWFGIIFSSLTILATVVLIIVLVVTDMKRAHR